MHGSLEDYFLVIRIPWLNKVITYLLTYFVILVESIMTSLVDLKISKKKSVMFWKFLA